MPKIIKTIKIAENAKREVVTDRIGAFGYRTLIDGECIGEVWGFSSMEDAIAYAEGL